MFYDHTFKKTFLSDHIIWGLMEQRLTRFCHMVRVTQVQYLACHCCGPAVCALNVNSLDLASKYFSDSLCLIFALYLNVSQYRECHACLFDSYAFICSFKGPSLLFYLVKPPLSSHPSIVSLLFLLPYGTHNSSSLFF